MTIEEMRAAVQAMDLPRLRLAFDALAARRFAMSDGTPDHPVLTSIIRPVCEALSEDATPMPLATCLAVGDLTPEFRPRHGSTYREGAAWVRGNMRAWLR